MTDRDKNTAKNLLIVMAMLVVLVVGSIGAYFTATDEASNSFTVGKIAVKIAEPNWSALTDTNENDIPDVAECVLPNAQIAKDPTVKNTSEKNDAFVFVKVTVPKATILTSNVGSGAKAKSAVETQLFQLNDSNNTDAGNGLVWAGTDTYNTDSWYLVKEDTSADNVNEYIYAYGNSVACTALAAGESTAQPVFNSVTFCNAVGGQELELSTQAIKVEAFAIQSTDLTANDKTEPLAVWAILNAQESSGV